MIFVILYSILSYFAYRVWDKFQINVTSSHFNPLTTYLYPKHIIFQLPDGAWLHFLQQNSIVVYPFHQSHPRLLFIRLFSFWQISASLFIFWVVYKKINSRAQRCAGERDTVHALQVNEWCHFWVFSTAKVLQKCDAHTIHTRVFTRCACTSKKCITQYWNIRYFKYFAWS